MKTFFFANKRSFPGAIPSRITISSPSDFSRRIDSVAVRQILRGPRLQTKRTIGAPDDVQEQEVARVTDEVIRMPEPGRQAADGSWAVKAQTFVMGNDIVFGRERNKRRTAETDNGDPAVSRASGDWTLVDGFPIDNRYCFCDFQIEKELDWVRFMADLFRQCKREAEDGTAKDAVACKTNKFEEAGIKTKLVGSVDREAKVHVDDWPGPCGPIFRFGVNLHETVHRDYIAHGQTPVLQITKQGETKKQKELLELSEVSAREYSANEIKAYKREEKFLEKVLKALGKRCSPGDYLTTDPEFYQYACGQLDLEMGLDFPPGAGWSRRDIEDSWPGLKGKCWWFLDPVGGGGYNCYGYCFRDEEGLRVVEPSLQADETFDAFFSARGYEPTSGIGDIALFSESHVARRSQHSFQGKQLWESKLSREAPLILHQLKDIQGHAFGKVIAYYSRVSR